MEFWRVVNNYEMDAKMWLVLVNAIMTFISYAPCILAVPTSFPVLYCNITQRMVSLRGSLHGACSTRGPARRMGLTTIRYQSVMATQ
jgi:hypothetical protein